jgi:hypothetical protein
MNQSPISLELAPEALTAIEQALETLEKYFGNLPGMRPEQRQRLAKMGDKSEAFCRQAVVTFAQNPDVMTRNCSCWTRCARFAYGLRASTRS